MSQAARSIFIFGIYLFCLSIVLLVFPNTLLTLFGMPPTNEVWIRVVGMLVFFLGYYYVQAARGEVVSFFRWTVYGRAAVVVFLTAFVLLNFAQPALILFGIVDLLGAVWTRFALRSSGA